MFASDEPSCPVKIFKEYVSRRPPEMNQPDAPFYLTAIPKPSTEIWFKRQPLGKHPLSKFMKEMSKAAGLDGRFTNHSVRRTMISVLRKENVEPLNIIALAGQRNLKYLDSYSEASTNQQQEMSSKISDHIEGKPSKASNEKVPLQAINFSPSKDPSELKQGMFFGAVFNNCSINVGEAPAAEPCFNLKKKFKRICPLDSDDEL